MSSPDGDVRGAEVVTSLGAVRARIAAACEAAGRDVQQVTLIAVTKTRPAADVATLVRLGVLDIGENKDQEARQKVAELADGGGEADTGVRWHLVGRLQSNKSRSVASYAHAVHSLDRPKLVRSLADASVERSVPLEIFVQVSLDGDPDRGGVAEDGLLALADAVAGRTELRLRGVMAVPPVGADPQAAFARLADLSTLLRTQHPDADAISAGMSDDLETAVRNGSTHVRVGTALLGRRGPIFS